MHKSFKIDERGFTLIELMVVVAIIGVLSAIAVPNFKKYQAKAKKSEAKIQLAAMYTTEVGSMADYDSYATCLSVLGYEQPARGYYAVGFASAEVANVKARNSNCVSDEYQIFPATPLKAGGSVYPSDAQLNLISGYVDSVNGNEFVIGAVGNISGTMYDYWGITHTKDMQNIEGTADAIFSGYGGYGSGGGDGGDGGAGPDGGDGGGKGGGDGCVGGGICG